MAPRWSTGCARSWLTSSLPYLIGGIIPGLIVAIICYWVIGPLIAAYQERRRKKLLAIQARQRARIDAELAAYGSADAREGDNA